MSCVRNDNLLYGWCMRLMQEGLLPEFVARLVAHNGGAIDNCGLRCNERSVETEIIF